MHNTRIYIICLLGISCGVSSFTYEAPENCEWKFRDPIKREVSLSCNLRTMSRDFDSNNLNMAESDYTVELNVLCSDVLFFQSSLQPRTFQRLYNLDTLEIEFCKLTSLPGGTFLELDELRRLTVRTHNSDWSAMALELSKDSLIGMPKLEKLDLGQNNIWNLPDRVFCPLPGLRHLNLTWNRLQDVSEIGVSGGCGAHLVTLDLSGNDLVILPQEGLAGMTSLKELFLQYNDISMLADGALVGLSSLKTLNISSNRLVALPTDALNETFALLELYLQNNSISVLSPGIFSSLSQLTVLDMSNNHLSSQWVTDETFRGLVRLVVLGLSHNKLVTIERNMFEDLSALQILDLSDNEVFSIADDTFSPLANLHRLDLSKNRLSTLGSKALSGLHVLSSLYISQNNLTSVHVQALSNCTNLRDLRLDYNFLSSIPEAVSLSPSVRTLRLSHNLITAISSTDLIKLLNIRHLDMSSNFLKIISKEAFLGLNELEVLDMSNNDITSISHGIFDTNKALELLRLDGNKISDINGLFASLPRLLWLNVSDNEISWFDYALIPEKLIYLDLRNNKIKEIGNYFNIESKLNLRTLDISHNVLQHLSSSSVPNSIELLFVNSNRITHVSPGTFIEKRNLSMVDLFNNLLTQIELNSISLSPMPEQQKLPEFYIGGNPIFCDCKMEWMHRVNQISALRQHSRIMDLDKVTCTLPYPRAEQNMVPFLETHSSQFLCPYSSHCFALCQCCDFIACDCQMNCPAGCSCYHDDTWATNIVDCSAQRHHQLPDDFPMDATVVYMDGNDMPFLEAHRLIGRKNLRSLYLNNSNIERIENRTFHGLSSLKVLHLENNLLTSLAGFEFEHLEHLRQLFLENNRLRFINNSTFVELKSIELIHLDGNFLSVFPVWQFNFNKGLKQLKLAENSWSCECQFIANFKNWLNRYNDIVIDSKKVICVNNATRIPGPNVLKTFYECENFVATSIVQEKMPNGYLQPVLIAIGIFFLILVLTVVFVMIRVKWQRSVSKKCGLKWFPPESSSCSKTDENNLIYDVFISHSELDSAFINDFFAAELEAGDPCYKLCLSSRDYETVGTYVGDFIVNSMESSRKIMLVLTKNFLDNDWCKFSFKAAHLEALKKARNKVIVVVCAGVEEHEIDADLALIIRNSSQLKYEDNKTFWSKLRASIPGGRKNINQQCYISETNYIMRNNLSGLSPTHTVKGGQLIPNMVLNGSIKASTGANIHHHNHNFHSTRPSTKILHHHHNLQQLGPAPLLHHQNARHHHHQQLSGGSNDTAELDKTFVSIDTAQSSLSPSLSHSYMSLDYISSRNSHIYASIDDPSNNQSLTASTLATLQPIMNMESQHPPLHRQGPDSLLLHDKPGTHRQMPHGCHVVRSEPPIISPSYFI